MSILEMKKVSFTYPNNPVIKNLSYGFECGKVYAITGRSGAGKTTVLSLLSGLMAPVKGNILYNGVDISKINKYEYRSRDVGVIFQEYNLLPKFTARENILLSLDISGKKLDTLKDFGKFDNKNDYADALLELVGLEKEIADSRILKISGGQQQRIAIARALSFQPKVILADEPTGNLDTDTSEDIMNVFLDLAHKNGRSIIIVTHSPLISEMADERLELKPLSRGEKV
ncbi:MAG: ABC transporter ATP-binding protein [Saccharofermentans sp.]|nr:ABC transporter ATP-binding protein [Saccharofermentans sp.]